MQVPGMTGVHLPAGAVRPLRSPETAGSAGSGRRECWDRVLRDGSGLVRKDACREGPRQQGRVCSGPVPASALTGSYSACTGGHGPWVTTAICLAGRGPTGKKVMLVTHPDGVVTRRYIISRFTGCSHAVLTADTSPTLLLNLTRSLCLSSGHPPSDRCPGGGMGQTPLPCRD